MGFLQYYQLMLLNIRKCFHIIKFAWIFEIVISVFKNIMHETYIIINKIIIINNNIIYTGPTTI